MLNVLFSLGQLQASQGDVIAAIASRSPQPSGVLYSMESTTTVTETLYVPVAFEDKVREADDAISVEFSLDATPKWDPFPTGNPAWQLTAKPEGASDLTTSQQSSESYTYSGIRMGTYEFKVTHIDSAKINVEFFSGDLDIDTNNDSGFDIPTDSLEEDEDEDLTVDDAGEPIFGKLIETNLGDKDGDGIPDFADGYDLALAEGDAELSVGAFVPIRFEFPEELDITKSKITFEYSASDPDPRLVSFTEDEETGIRTWTPAPGAMRIWIKDETEERKYASVPDGHFVPARTEIAPSDLGISSDDLKVELYIEAIEGSASLGDARIAVEVDPDGSDAHVSVEMDAVRATLLKVDMVPDYDRDGEIDQADRGQVTDSTPFRWWFNNDNPEFVR